MVSHRPNLSPGHRSLDSRRIRHRVWTDVTSTLTIVSIWGISAPGRQSQVRTHHAFEEATPRYRMGEACGFDDSHVDLTAPFPAHLHSRPTPTIASQVQTLDWLVGGINAIRGKSHYLARRAQRGETARPMRPFLGPGPLAWRRLCQHKCKDPVHGRSHLSDR